MISADAFADLFDGFSSDALTSEMKSARRQLRAVHLYHSFAAPCGEWTEAYNLGGKVNGPGTDFCASVSPDGKYIFYTKNRDIYWVSIKVIEQFKK